MRGDKRAKALRQSHQEVRRSLVRRISNRGIGDEDARDLNRDDRLWPGCQCGFGRGPLVGICCVETRNCLALESELEFRRQRAGDDGSELLHLGVGIGVETSIAVPSLAC